MGLLRALWGLLSTPTLQQTLFLHFLNFISLNELNALWHFLDFITSKLYFINSHHVSLSTGDRKAITLVLQMKKQIRLNYNL